MTSRSRPSRSERSSWSRGTPRSSSSRTGRASWRVSVCPGGLGAPLCSSLRATPGLCARLCGGSGWALLPGSASPSSGLGGTARIANYCLLVLCCNGTSNTGCKSQRWVGTVTTLQVSRRVKAPEFPWGFPVQSVWDVPGCCPIAPRGRHANRAGLALPLCPERSFVPSCAGGRGEKASQAPGGGRGARGALCKQLLGAPAAAAPGRGNSSALIR